MAEKKYKSPHSTITGGMGYMWNEATVRKIKIPYEDYGIYSNDNTYAITFNEKLNRPPMWKTDEKIIRYPSTKQRETKTYFEPPVSMTDGRFFVKSDKCQKTPVLPVYLKKPEDLGRIQGLTKNGIQEYVIYGPTHTITETRILY